MYIFIYTKKKVWCHEFFDPARTSSKTLWRWLLKASENFRNQQKHNSAAAGSLEKLMKTCRFNIPYWPMEETRILLPMAKTDGRRSDLKSDLIRFGKFRSE